MLIRRSRLALISLSLLVAPCAPAATIDRMTTANFGNYFDDNSLTFGMAITSWPDFYYLSDGTSWGSGAGSFQAGSGRPVNETVVGNTIRYEMKMSGNSPLMDYTDYDAGNHSSKGRLEPWGPLVIEAAIGSKTATLNGYALIVRNDLSNYSPPAYVYYSAPVGWAAPMRMTYTLGGNATWQPGIFDTNFTYQTNGEIRFNEAIPVPEPGAASVMFAFATALLTGAGRRRSRHGASDC
jgi:hypothetical protein